MHETFSDTALVDESTLSRLSERNDSASAWRLTVHFTSIGACLVVASSTLHSIWVTGPVLLLSFLLATLFAPFHECSHGTAFATASYNRFGALLTGVLFGSSWLAYRRFHFLHHQHTQDPQNDPEIAPNPRALSLWPENFSGWLRMLSGFQFLAGKVSLLSNCWRLGNELEQGQRRQSQLASVFWLSVFLCAVFGVGLAIVLSVAFLLSHVTLGLWLSAEHTGCAESGSIFERTRSVVSNRLVRFYLWNMNYHSEHHAWPAVPWHQLPHLHQLVSHSVGAQASYTRLYQQALRANYGV